MSKERRFAELVKIKGLVREKKKNYDEYAEYTKLNRATVCNILNGYSQVTGPFITKTCDFLEIEKDKIAEYFAL